MVVSGNMDCQEVRVAVGDLVGDLIGVDVGVDSWVQNSTLASFA